MVANDVTHVHANIFDTSKPALQAYENICTLSSYVSGKSYLTNTINQIRFQALPLHGRILKAYKLSDFDCFFICSTS